MNNKSLIILVDQDGVLANYQERFLELWRNAHPEKFWLPTEMLTEHDTDKNYPSEYRELIEDITLQKGFFESLQPIAGGKEALEELLARGHDVRICTAPKREHQHCVPEKFAWVEKYLGKKWTERIVLTRDKTLVYGDILIDDKPNITGIATPTWKHIFYDQPYNRTHSGPRLTWKNYQEVLDI